jgi:hypothetical protein
VHRLQQGALFSNDCCQGGRFAGGALVGVALAGELGQ